MTTTEAALAKGVPRVTILKWIQRGHLKATKIGRDWHIRPSDLDKVTARKYQRKTNS